MSNSVRLTVPDLGDFSDVEVIEVLVSVGDTVAVEDPLITLETDKAAMDVPSTAAGRIVSIDVKTGDKVNAGDAFATLEPEAASDDSGAKQRAAADEPADEPAAEPEDVRTQVMTPEEIDVATGRTGQFAAAAPEAAGDATHRAQLVVIGAGPGGYSAAFRAADLGLDVVMVERWPMLGGVCLNVGCIPSKALLHAAKVIDDAEAMAAHGVEFGPPKVDADKLRAWKDKVVGRLVKG
ncbi:MAG TPA: biotin/lipoyl-containing protein, partial [Woeseiaceae bacterium]|nr:biotin/lipoyl-containing protein [Woeseiaceae bacterium]